MCGITGVLDPSARRSAAAGERLIQAMTDILSHRGPDGDGIWVDAAAGIAFGHRRLAIIDLSDAGRQPMLSVDGRFAITFNGEIYNYRALRAELEQAGRRFHTQTDTEVILQACDAWGVEAAVGRFIGMFAFGLWDRRDRRLFLVRDRLGIKPLYWGRCGGEVVFASQPKSFACHPAWQPEIDRNALVACLRFNYVPAPLSVWRDVHKLRPGHLVVVEPGGTVREHCYWDLGRIAGEAVASRRTMDEAAATDELERLLGDAVKLRMIADVPLGAFLSGGIDSSTVVALMQQASPQPVRTFTIGFRVPDFNEADHAAAIARHLGTDHTELYVEPTDALDLVPRIAEFYDEPFADVSQIPTYLVSRLTRQSVTVSLSGDGGDEVFAGYNRYTWASRLQRGLGWLPPAGRRGLAAAVLTLPPDRWDRLFRLALGRRRPAMAGDRMHKLAGLFAFTGSDDLYRRLVSFWDDPAALVPGSSEPPSLTGDPALADAVPDFTERMQLVDELTYLPDDILAKVDRASMAVGLEARVPLLDHRVVEFGWRLPPALRQRDGTGKWLLRQVLRRHVPSRLTDRPKMGFGVPIADWLRGPLRDWAEDLLSPAALAEDDLFDPQPIRRRLAEHQSGTRNWQYSLWGVLMIQAWRRRWMQAGGRPEPVRPTAAAHS